jgi:hypothetical protein
MMSIPHSKSPRTQRELVDSWLGICALDIKMEHDV